MTSEEEWKDVEGYEGIYKVSSLGRVYSVPRTAPNNGQCGGYCLKPQKYRNGYVFYHLTKNGKTKGALAHRLVAKAFIPNHDDLGEVNHIDGDKENNAASNLEWCTRSQNNAHAFSTGLRSLDGMWAKAHEANQRPVIFSFDGSDVARFPSMKAAALVTGINKSSISACARGANKTCDGFEVRYADEEDIAN